MLGEQETKPGQPAKRLTEAERQLAVLVANLPGMVYRGSAVAPWAMFYVSDGAERLTGYSVSDFESGRVAWADVVHPDDMAELEFEVGSGVEKRRLFSIVYRIIHRSGEVRWVHERGTGIWQEGVETPVAVEGVILDVTAQKMAEARLAEREEWYRNTVELNTQIPWSADPEGNIVLVGDRWRDGAFGLKREETFGQGWISALHPDDRESTLETWATALKSGRRLSVEYRFRLADGSYRWFRARAAARRDGQGRIVRWYGLLEDIHELVVARRALEASEERLRWAAHHDTLTTLPNRLLFQERFEQALANARGHGRRVALLHIDVDHFKKVNDTRGHEAGDVLLRTFAERMRDAVRAGDTVARLGGDEFAIVLPDLGPDEDIVEAAAAIFARVLKPIPYNGELIACHATTGVSVYPQHGDSAEQLLRHADVALYKAKAAGRGQLMMFQPGMQLSGSA